ncbi:MAG: hypothetical protein RLZZ562_3452 [Planctomycetota bacterium]|jgi:hypothetical protein
MREFAPRVTLVDSGIDDGHPGVRGLAISAAFAVDADGCVVAEARCRDPLGHGTAIAATMRASSASLQVASIRVFDAVGDASPTALAAALRHAATLDAAVVNCSLGFSRTALRDAAWDAIADAATSILRAKKRLCVPAALHSGMRNALSLLDGVDSVVADPNLSLHESPRFHQAHGAWFACSLPPSGIPGLPPSRIHGGSLACARVAVWLAAAQR